MIKMKDKKFNSVAEALESAEKKIKVEQKSGYDTYHDKNPMSDPDYQRAREDLQRAHEKFESDVTNLSKKLNLTDQENDYLWSYVHDDTRKM